MDNTVTPMGTLVSATFWGLLLSCFLFPLIEAPVLFMTKRMEGKRPITFAVVAALILLMLLAGDFVVGFLLLAFAGLEQMGVGASDKGGEYIAAAQWVFLLVLPILLVARRGMLAAFKFQGNGAAWGYALASTFVIAVLLFAGKFLAHAVPVMKG